MIKRLKRAWQAFTTPPAEAEEPEIDEEDIDFGAASTYFENMQNQHSHMEPLRTPLSTNSLDRLTPQAKSSYTKDIKPVFDSLNKEFSAKLTMDASPGYDVKGQMYAPMSGSLFRWYASHGFIGYQACAYLSQNWLMQRIITVPAEDALKNEFYLTTEGGGDLDADVLSKIGSLDKKYKLSKNLIEAERNRRIFGVRVVYFAVKSNDPKYYKKPFNPDGISKGSYLGMRQIDPYWIIPQFDSDNMTDPFSEGFYEPEFWATPNKKIHKSHCVVLRYAEVPDILKPSYLYGGISLMQMAMERVYSAERGANDLSELMLSKRLYTQGTDIKKAALNPQKFFQRMQFIDSVKDNFGRLLHDTKDVIGQQNTPLTDSDNAVLTLYQLVASIASMPVTKLLGTTPKGFNATGEHEIDSYNSSLGVWTLILP